ncbi:MAG: Mrp/NBP35 family ATP-binding protein [Myxococcota bacterium]
MFGKKGKDGMDEERVRALVGALQDPVDGKKLSERLQRVELGRSIQLDMTLPTPAWGSRFQLEEQIRKALQGEGATRDIQVRFGFDVQRARPQGSAQSLVPGAKNVVLFASGKGGVGKSTVATNVAAAFAKLGASVGLLDSDIYGPSIPTMLGVNAKPEVVGQKLMPIERYGMKLMSIGFIVDPHQAMSWRGPMLNGALTQFMRDVEWGELDYLFLDLPPGTGDVQLTIAQNLKVSGAVLVSTPQDVALADVIRGKAMFDRVDVPILGVVENMAYFVCPNCSERHSIFSSGGAGRIADELKLPLLAEIPFEIETRQSADVGEPEVLAHPESSAAQAFVELSLRIGTELAKSAARQSMKAGVGLKIIQ